MTPDVQRLLETLEWQVKTALPDVSFKLRLDLFATLEEPRSHHAVICSPRFDKFKLDVQEAFQNCEFNFSITQWGDCGEEFEAREKYKAGADMRWTIRCTSLLSGNEGWYVLLSPVFYLADDDTLAEDPADYCGGQAYETIYGVAA